ncbi:hypothetical protein FRC04_007516 [Tulasnella sp. 424]|nr:hypothetical protein FRC04_007516 [Tulasnella sp. 424]
MNQLLRENVCNLCDLSKSSSEVQDIVERDLSKGIQYCCRSWPIHLTEGKRWSESGADGVNRHHEADFETFSKEKVLFWLEVMSLVGATNEAVSMAKQVYQWLSTWKQVGEPLTGHTDEVNSVCFSPDGKLLASGSDDETIRLWDPQTGKQFGEPLTGHTDWCYSVCFSLDGKLLASGSKGTIRLWDPQTGKQFGEPLTGHTWWVNSVCFSPDGKLLASGSSDQTIRLWDPQTGKQFGEPLTGHTDWVNSVCFSPDGKLLASGSDDETIRLWDPQTGKQFGEPLTGHTDRVNSVCFSPDGKLLASGSDDETICLWDPQTGKQVGEPLKGHGDNTQLIWDTLALQRTDIQPDAPSPVTSAFVKDHWVTLSSSRLFWLPPQYWNYHHIVILSRGKLAVTAEESLYIFDVSSALELDHRLAAYS